MRCLCAANVVCKIHNPVESNGLGWILIWVVLKYLIIWVVLKYLKNKIKLKLTKLKKRFSRKTYFNLKKTTFKLIHITIIHHQSFPGFPTFPKNTNTLLLISLIPKINERLALKQSSVSF